MSRHPFSTDPVRGSVVQRSGTSRGAGIVCGRAVRMLLVAVAATLALEERASAQYFGQNKVRYRTIDFEVLATEHFNVHFPKDARLAAVDAGRMAERWYLRLSRLLHHRLSSRQDLVLYATKADFRGTSVILDAIGETTSGLTERAARRIVMPVGTSLAETDHVLGHELVHAFQFDMAEAGASAAALPLWFVEGMAEYLSLGPESNLTTMWLRDATARNMLPTVKELDDPRYFPYRWGHAFWSHVGRRAGDDAIGPLYRRATRTGAPADALEAVLRIDAVSFSTDWHAAIVERVRRPEVDDTRDGTVRKIVMSDPPGGSLQLGPVVSPDGKLVAFFSDDGIASVDLFVADVESGRVRSRLTDMVTDPHTDSLQFSNSSGAWSADSRQFVFGTTRGGRVDLVFYDIAAEQVVRTLPVPPVDEVLGVSWSPDGQKVVLSGMANGSTDLFLLDLSSGTVRRLTDDAYADLQPAFAPDGRRVAFVTDRSTTNRELLSAGPLRLAIIDVSDGSCEMVPAFDQGHHVSPHWSADGLHLYFVAAPGGTTDVYRLSLKERVVRQVTRVTSGVSGLSEMSPPFSFAGNRGVASIFRDGRYELHAIDLASRGEEIGPPSRSNPPDARVDDTVIGLLRNATAGLASASTFTVGPYRPRLRLESFAPLSAGIGVSDFGAYVGGGTAFSLTDTLGHHRVVVGLQSGTFGGGDGGNLSVFGAYLNQRSRWDWGFRGGQSVQPTRGYSTGLATIGSQLAVVEEEVTGRQTNREVAAVLARPFSRATRIEMTGGLQTISFSAESTATAFDATTGRPVGSSTASLPAPHGESLVTTSAALVHDTASFGGTGPRAGMRYRLEGGVTAGTATFAALLADLRRYTPLGGPFSIAARAMHVGRYGTKDDSRIGDLTIGYSSLVRGYELASYTPADCGSELGRCEPLQRLFGSRIAVANLELRTALIGPRAVVRRAAAPPVDLALFADAGLAWAPVGRPDTSNRTPLTSVGASVRFSVFGLGVGQLSYVRPNSRIEKNWRWEFSLTPGF